MLMPAVAAVRARNERLSRRVLEFDAILPPGMSGPSVEARSGDNVSVAAQ